MYSPDNLYVLWQRRLDQVENRSSIVRSLPLAGVLWWYVNLISRSAEAAVQINRLFLGLYVVWVLVASYSLYRYAEFQSIRAARIRALWYRASSGVLLLYASGAVLLGGLSLLKPREDLAWVVLGLYAIVAFFATATGLRWFVLPMAGNLGGHDLVKSYRPGLLTVPAVAGVIAGGSILVGALLGMVAVKRLAYVAVGALNVVAAFTLACLAAGVLREILFLARTMSEDAMDSIR